MFKPLLSLLALSLSLFATAATAPYTIYPIPHSQQPLDGTTTTAAEINIVAGPGIDDVTVARAMVILSANGLKGVRAQAPGNGSNLLLGVKGSGDDADKAATLLGLESSVFENPGYDRHIVALLPDAESAGNILILGENTDATFYGLSTLAQILAQASGSLPSVLIADYGDQASRGIIEGYYGVPYNADVTKDLFPFMASTKMNTYMYGAKSDPYHTRYWELPYPETITADEERIGYLTRDMLRDIVAKAHENKVNFIWAIHPGKAFIDSTNTEVNKQIMNKFQDMYDLGVRQFGVFVDDVGVPYDEPTQRFNAARLSELQNLIDQRWNNGTLSPADTVKPLQFVPQLYAYSWTTPDKAKDYFQSLGETPRKVDIYITGAKIWSVPNNADLDSVSSWLGRDVAWWWNYPCNDQDPTKLFPMDMYNNFRDEKYIADSARLEPQLKGLRTLIANPMQQGEISKIALFGLADYSWNNAAYNNEASWNAALEAIVGPDYAPALRRAAQYLRYYDADTFQPLAYAYNKSVEEGAPNPQPIVQELSEVVAACRKLEGLATSASESDRLFYADMAPWLHKLQTMAQMTIDLLEGRDVSGYPDLDEAPEFRFDILKGMGEEIKLQIRTAEPATQSLRPFLDSLRK